MRKGNLYIFLLLLLTIVFDQSTKAATIDGGTGLVRVPYASTLGRGKLLVNSQMANTVNFGEYVYYAAIGQGGALYGIDDKWDVWLNWRWYQDNVIANPGEGVGNIKLGTKYNFFNQRRNKYNLSGELILLFPMASFYNIDWEPYTSGKLEFSAGLLGTFLKRYHGLFRYIYHNDSDVGLENHDAKPYTKAGESAIHEIFLGTGYEYPIIRDILISTGELTIRKALNSKQNMRSSELWMILTPGIKYFLNDNLFVGGGLDLRLVGGKNDFTVFNIDEDADLDPSVAKRSSAGFYKDNGNYPSWRLNIAINWLAFQKYPTAVRRRPDVREDDQGYLDIIEEFGEVGISEELQDKMKLYKKLKTEQRETKEAEKELVEIKKKREEAEDELKKLRDLLEHID